MFRVGVTYYVCLIRMPSKRTTPLMFRVGVTYYVCLIRMPSKRSRPPRLDVNAIDFSSLEHLTILGEMGVVVEPLGQGRYQVSHVVQKAKTPEDAEEGWFLIQEIMKLNTDQNKKQGQHSAVVGGWGYIGLVGVVL